MGTGFVPGEGESRRMVGAASASPEGAEGSPVQEGLDPELDVMAARLVDLESADAWHRAVQEDSARELYELSRRVSRLESTVQALTAKLKELAEGLEGSPVHDRRPPHY